MSSARDRFKKANNNFVHLGSEANKETIVDDIIEGLESQEKKNEDPEPPKKEVSVDIKEELKPIIEARDTIEKTKRKAGRKPKYANTKEMIRLNMSFPEENYMFIKKNGWEFDGMNGFVNHLIEEEMKRRGE